MARAYNGIREQRPNTYNDLGGDSADLSCAFSGKQIKMADRSFSQGLQCQQVNDPGASAEVVHLIICSLGCEVDAKTNSDCDR
ncbi:MAG: hypothetical protein LBQ68_07560 [Clostridiales bacterium]|jgi:hypothetical protein|nr:hypothetical protein [Clostridiales bacterium]